MRIPRNQVVALLLIMIGAVGGSCASGSASARAVPSSARVAAGSERPIPLILAADQGERRVRRTLGGARLLVKVDPVVEAHAEAAYAHGIDLFLAGALALSSQHR